MSRNNPPGWRNRGRGGGGNKVNHTATNKTVPKNRINVSKQLVSVTDEHEDVKTGIREILLRLEPLVKVSGGNAPLESMMSYLEEIDDSNFEKYMLVRHIKSKLKTSLFELVQAEVKIQCRDTQLTPEKMKIVAPAILSKLMTSSEMDDCLDNLNTEMGEAVSDMCANFDRELVLMSQLRDSLNDIRPGSRNSSGLSDSLSSTWNQGGFIFIQPNQYAKLADKLNPYRAAEDRIEALNTLVASQVSECVGSASWPLIREGLQAALMDSSHSGVSSIALRLYAKMLTNISPFCTKEAFVSLASTIIGLYKDKSRNYQLPSIATEVSFKKRPTHNLLQICRLITRTCKELPRFWNRYPPSHIDEIMRSMLVLITLKSRGQKILSPVHLISLVDPKANWLKAWLHGNIGRHMFFHLVEQTHDNLMIKTSVHHLLAALEKDNFPLLSRSSGRKKGLLTSSLVSFAFLSHNLKVTCLTLQYQKGQTMFPLTLPNREESIDCYFIMKTLIHFVAHSYQPSHLTIAKMICNSIIEHLGNSEKNIKKFWINEKIMDILLAPLINWSQHQQTYLALNLCRLHEVILSSETGIAFAQDVKIEASGLSMPEFLLDFTTQFLKSMLNLNHQTEKLMLIGICVCKKIVLNHACVLSPTFQLFVKAVANALFDLEDLSSKTPTNSMANISIESHSIEIKKELLDLLKNVITTPKGLFVVGKINGLLPILIEEGEFESIEFLALAVFTVNGKFVLEDNAFLEKTLTNISKMFLEHDLTYWPNNTNNEEKLAKYLSTLVTVLSDLDYLNKNFHLLQDLMPFQDQNSCIIQDDSAFHIRLLLCLVSDLDVQLLILTKIDLKQKIEVLLNDCQHEDGAIMTDSTYMITQNLSKMISEIGGPTERKDEPLSRQVSEEDHEIFQKMEELKTFFKKQSKPINLNVKAKVLYKECASQLKLETLKELISGLIENDNEIPISQLRELSKEESVAIELFRTYIEKHGYSDNISNQCLSQILQQTPHDPYGHLSWTVLVLGAVFSGNVTKTNQLSRIMKLDQDDLISRIGHLVEMIVIEEMPMLLPCLNFPISVIVRQWVKQCFLNTLDWVDIIHFILIQALIEFTQFYSNLVRFH